jgi:hypothetical protein
MRRTLDSRFNTFKCVSILKPGKGSWCTRTSIISSVCNPTDTAAYSEFVDKGRSDDVSRRVNYRAKNCVPANRFTNGYEKILSLLCNWGKGLENNVAIIRTNPQGPRRVVRFKMKPGEVLIHEDVRHEGILLPTMCI